eukprot:SAG31_NODE_2444_length_5683_cov_2.031160_1_plen_109_part_00
MKNINILSLTYCIRQRARQSQGRHKAPYLNFYPEFKYLSIVPLRYGISVPVHESTKMDGTIRDYDSTCTAVQYMYSTCVVRDKGLVINPRKRLPLNLNLVSLLSLVYY